VDFGVAQNRLQNFTIVAVLGQTNTGQRKPVAFPGIFWVKFPVTLRETSWDIPHHLHFEKHDCISVGCHGFGKVLVSIQQGNSGRNSHIWTKA
jgi:hypothetical protein